MKCFLLLLLLFCLWPVDCTTPWHISRNTHRNSRTTQHPTSMKKAAVLHQQMSLVQSMRRSKSVADRGCLPTDGTAYTGTANTTESGLTCKTWAESEDADYDFTEVGQHNFCRSPDGSERVWCYTTDVAKLWEHCDVEACVSQRQSAEEIGCQTVDAGQYTGRANITMTGLTCRAWDSVHKAYGVSGLGEHNYCRDPYGIGLFCFTTDRVAFLDHCDVPFCEEVYTKGMISHPLL